MNREDSLADLFQSAQVNGRIGRVLANRSANLGFAKELLAMKTTNIEESADYKIFRTGDHHAGYIGLCNNRDQTLDYIVRFSAYDNDVLKTTTQLRLWRRTGSPYVQGLTKKILSIICLESMWRSSTTQNKLQIAETFG